MKKLLLFFFIGTFGAAIAQDTSIPKNGEGKYEYTAIVNLDSGKAEKLYSNAKIFIAEAFKSGKEVTQLNDDASKTVIGKGTTKISYKGLMGAAIIKYVEFNFTIHCKDNRYKYSIGDLVYFQTYGASSERIPLEDEKRLLKRSVSKNQLEQLYKQVTTTMDILIGNLTKSMASQTASTQEW